MSGEKGRRIRRSMWAVDSGARKAPPVPTPSGGTPPGRSPKGGVYIQKRRRANAFRNAHFKRYEGRPLARSIERSTSRHTDAMSDAYNTAPIAARRRPQGTAPPPPIERSTRRPKQRSRHPRRTVRAAPRNSVPTPSMRAVPTASETAPAQRPAGRSAHRSFSATPNGVRTARNTVLAPPPGTGHLAVGSARVWVGNGVHERCSSSPCFALGAGGPR